MKAFYLKIILVLITFSSINSANAQYQSIFGNSQTSWNIYSEEFAGGFTDSLVACCDTVINSKTYKKINFYKFFSLGNPILQIDSVFLREDTASGKVWEITPFDTINEYLLTNMSLTLTDSFEVISGQYFDVDSIYIKNGRKHIRLEGPLYATFTEKFTMIEGIITNVAPVRDLWSNYSTYLLCSYKDGNVEYLNTHPFYVNQCFLITGINGKESNTKINIYPNPSTRKLTIEYQSNNSKGLIIEIYNITGQLKLRQEMNTVEKTTINTNNIPVGIYFISVKDEEEVITTKKWIKTE